MPYGYRAPKEYKEGRDKPETPEPADGMILRKKHKPSWHLPPEVMDEPVGRIPREKLHKIAARAERRAFSAAGQVSPYESQRFSTKSGWVYWWKPPWITFGFGVPAAVLIVGQTWLPDLDSALGGPLGGFVGLTRLGLILLGGYLLFVAAPLHKPPDWTPEKQREIDSARDYFRRKRRL